MNKAVFIDKDGTLIEDVPYNVDPDLIRLQPGAAEGLRQLKADGYLLILISNQSGIAHGYFQERDLDAVVQKLNELLRPDSLLNGAFFCPHHPDGTIASYTIACECRKPKPGLILKAAEQFNVDLSRSWMIGDILHDIEAGNKAGCRTILIDNGNETEWEMNDYRVPTARAANLREAASFILNNSCYDRYTHYAHTDHKLI